VSPKLISALPAALFVLACTEPAPAIRVGPDWSDAEKGQLELALSSWYYATTGSPAYSWETGGTDEFPVVYKVRHSDLDRSSPCGCEKCQTFGGCAHRPARYLWSIYVFTDTLETIPEPTAFYTVLLHELGHAGGIYSDLDEASCDDASRPTPVMCPTYRGQLSLTRNDAALACDWTDEDCEPAF
jgi:hypothetical protein